MLGPASSNPRPSKRAGLPERALGGLGRPGLAQHHVALDHQLREFGIGLGQQGPHLQQVARDGEVMLGHANRVGEQRRAGTLGPVGLAPRRHRIHTLAVGPAVAVFIRRHVAGCGARGRRHRLEPDLQLTDIAGKLGGVKLHFSSGQHPIGAQARRTGFIGRRRLGQPAIDFGRRQAPQHGETQRHVARDRKHLLPLVRAELQAVFPARLQGLAEPVAHLAPQPTGALGVDLPQAASLGHRVVDAAGMDLVAALPQKDRRRSLQRNLSRVQIDLQPFALDAHLLPRGPNDDRGAPGLDPSGLEVPIRPLLRRALGVLLARLGRAAARKVDRQLLAIELVARSVGMDPQHVDLLLERRPLLDRIETEPAQASDLHGQARTEIGDGRRGARRRLGRSARHKPLRARVKVQSLEAADLEPGDPGDAGSLFLAGAFRVAGQELDPQIAPSTVVGAQAEVDGMGRPDPLRVQVDVAGNHEQVVFGPRRAPAAADRDPSAESASDQAAHFAARQVKGFVEFEQGPLGSFENHGAALTLLEGRRGCDGRKDHRARGDFHRFPVALFLIVLQQELHLVAFQHFGVVELPGAGRKHAGQFLAPTLGGPGGPVTRSGGRPARARRGRRLDPWDRHHGVRPVRRHDDRQTADNAEETGHNRGFR